MAKSPRMVPGAEARGLVAPRRAERNISRQFIASRDVELTAASLDGVTALPDHSADGARGHVCPPSLVSIFPWACGGKHTLNQTGEEGLASKVGVVLLEVSLARGDKLDGNELEAVQLG